MSTSDQQGKTPLTRKQMREIRLTGATPVISEEEAAAAAADAQPAPPAPRPAAPVEVAPSPKADAEVELEDAPLTRRQAREQERIRTASVPVIAPEQADTSGEADAAEADVAEADAPGDAEVDDAQDEIVSGVPHFADGDAQASVAGDDDDLDDEVADIAPVSAASATGAGEVSIDGDESADGDAADAATDDDQADDADASEASEGLPTSEPVETGENHIVSPTFGNGLLKDKDDVPAFAPSFDELITADSGGSQNLAGNTLIFTPSAGDGSLSGPVASTGEILVTGSYELPRGIGSQGHAHGAADGKETDAVLLDGELHPSSSPTPIAASSAISTIKPAGEVIRPPAPEKGNKLMLTLAITAGGLALALAVALVVAFTTNIFS